MGRSVVLCVLAPAAAAFLVGSPSPRARCGRLGPGTATRTPSSSTTTGASSPTSPRSSARARAVLVRVAPSTVRGAGRGVFAARDAAAGATLTEWTGLVAAPPSSRCEEIELMCRYYGARWREYNGRYEIGLAAPTFAGGRARAELGDFVIYGAPSARRTADGVAQLINDHSAIFAPARRGALLADGLDGADGVGGRASVSVLARATRAYLERRAALNNVAMVRALRPAARRRACSRSRRAHRRGRGALLHVRRGLVARQAAARVPRADRGVRAVRAPQRALNDVVRAAEFVSLLHVDDERDCAGATGAVPRSLRARARAVRARRAVRGRRRVGARPAARGVPAVTECPFEEFLSVTEHNPSGEHGRA